jgi:hypothetical protein
MSRTSIAHIINPVIAGEDSDLRIAQPVTFETMRLSKEFSTHDLDVELHAAYFPEDESLVPDYFIKSVTLRNSILDSIDTSRETKKLPLIKDILDGLTAASNADYFIYTNADIAVMPYFYNLIGEFIRQGYDSFIINRRTLNNRYHSLKEIPLMFSDPGDIHPGSDCFVFRRDLYTHFKLGKVVIGAMFFGLTLRSNVIAYANKFEHFRDLHATFHLGNDRKWQTMFENAFFNASELYSIFTDLLSESPKYNYNDTVQKLFIDFQNRRKKLEQEYSQAKNFR